MQNHSNSRTPCFSTPISIMDVSCHQNHNESSQIWDKSVQFIQICGLFPMF